MLPHSLSALSLVAALSIAIPVSTSTFEPETASSAPTAEAGVSIENDIDTDTDTDNENQTRATVKGTIDALYEAFSFAPGVAFTTEHLSEFFLPEAVFVQPTAPGQPRSIDDLQKFYADFENFVNSDKIQKNGIYEDIVKTHTLRYGDLATALVTFQPRYAEPTDAPLARGLDSFQLVEIDSKWWIVSMTTRFESPSQPLPEQFDNKK